jgi:hypothetical protein
MQMIHQAVRIFTPGFASDRGHTPAFPQSDELADKGLVSQLLAGREGPPSPAFQSFNTCHTLKSESKNCLKSVKHVLCVFLYTCNGMAIDSRKYSPEYSVDFTHEKTFSIHNGMNH